MKKRSALRRFGRALVAYALLCGAFYLAARYYDLAFATYDVAHGQPDAALPHIARAIGSNQLTPGEKALAFYQRAGIHVARQEFLAAVTDATTAIELKPGFDDAYLVRATAFAYAGNDAPARADLERILAAQPRNAIAHRLRGAVLWDQNDRAAAIADFDFAARAEDATPYMHYRQGDAFQRGGYLGLAIGEYDAALALNRDLAEAYRSRAFAFVALSELAQARRDIDAAIALKPAIAPWHSERADILLSTGTIGDALAEYDRALAMDSALQTARRNRAVAEFAAGKFDDAEAGFADAAKQNPDDAYMVLWRYLAAARAGDGGRDALEDGAKALDLAAWPGPAIAMFLGRADAAAVLAAAKREPAANSHRAACEATYYLVQYQWLHGEKETTRTLLDKIVRNCHPASMEHVGAVADLARLGTP
jgi:lipoprotein NlpI